MNGGWGASCDYLQEQIDELAGRVVGLADSKTKLRNHIGERITDAEKMQNLAATNGKKNLEEYWFGKVQAYNEIRAILDDELRIA